MHLPPIVSPEEARAAWEAQYDQEREAIEAMTRLAAARRRLPMTKVEKSYRFEGPDGELSLADLFEGRKQLILYRFFFQPGVATYPEGGCPGCSVFIDQVGHPAHLTARDTTFAIVSPAPQPEIDAWKRRMGWERFSWYTTLDDFSVDFGVDEWYGLNMFLREGDDIYHTYAILGTSDVPFNHIGPIWTLLDLTALGRQERGEDSPPGWPQDEPGSWLKLHDEYDRS